MAIVKYTIGSPKISSLVALFQWPAFLDELSPFQAFFFSRTLFPEVQAYCPRCVKLTGSRHPLL